MPLSPDQNVRVKIGEMLVQNALMEAQIIALTQQVADLQAELDKLKPPVETPVSE